MSATVARTRIVARPVADVWAVLADFGGIARWAPRCDHSVLLRGEGVREGVVRRIQAGRNTLLETVDLVDADRRLGYRIEGLPMALGSIRNDWCLDDAGAGSEVTVTTIVDGGARPTSRVVEQVVARRLARESVRMLDGLADHLDRIGGDRA